jgi:AcrR family transcriptional regulator
VTRRAVPGVRRVPVQRRSAARVGRMLDACAALLDEVGYEATTTALIAERASVPIGSFYQYFPDKRTIVRALIQRYLETFVARVDRLLAEARPAHWWDAVDAVVDSYVDMHRAVPGFSSVRFGDVVDAHLLDLDRDNDEVVAGRFGELLASRFGVAADPRLGRAMTVAVTIADALLKRAFRVDPAGDPELIAEAKLAVRLYLSRGPHAGPGGGAVGPVS